MKKNKGITLVSLIVTIIIIAIVVGISVSSGGELFQKSKMSDYIGYMKLVKARADVVFEDNIFEDDQLTGDNLDSLDNNYDEMDQVIIKKGYDNTPKYKIKKWNKDIIASQGIDKSILGNDEYFVIVYDTENMETIDVIYSSGCGIDGNRYYSLNDMETIISGGTPTN